MKWTNAGLCLAVTLVAGCGYSKGELSYARHPDLSPVLLYSGRPNPVGVQGAFLQKEK